MENADSLVSTLEELLVQEFRICQNLHALTQSERQLLSKNDVQALSLAVEHKEALLDELGQVEDHRRMITQDLALFLGMNTEPATIAALAKTLQAKTLHSNAAGRMARLREGILALSSDIHNLTRGNHTLAMIALERVDAVQSFLLDLYRPSLVYQRPGVETRVTGLELAWDVDQGM